VEERRRNDDTRIDVLTERVENWMETTTSYRRDLCAKNDKIISEIASIKQSIATLPCPQRIEQTKGIHTQLKALWILVSATLLGIIGEWVKLK
jgi:hypothetical protein